MNLAESILAARTAKEMKEYWRMQNLHRSLRCFARSFMCS